AVWIGYSMGGRLALAGGVLRPDRVAALVLESASPGLAGPDERAERRALDEERARTLEEGGLEAWVDAWMSLPLFASQRELPEEVRARERRRRLRSSVEGLAWSLRELGTGSQPSFWDDLPGLDVPVLLLTGARDEKFCDLADAMASKLPRARRATIPGVGHAVHLEAPDAWLEAVGDFLDGIVSGERTHSDGTAP
ncbi:MAG TPA: alpha/beta fold hydrolase, partial [Longimicrobiales bacterium]|nr:alpha/beta fold hydrolase [Longimicrobiales bacterium]